MKRFVFPLALLLLSLSLSWAQPGRQHSHEKVEQYKIQFLTKELDLSPQEGQQFWPVYNAYKKELDQIQDHRRAEFIKRKLKDEADQLSDEELKKMVLEELDRQERIAQLKKRYFPQFEKAVGTRKAALYYKAEVEFHLRLMRRLQEFRKRP